MSKKFTMACLATLVVFAVCAASLRKAGAQSKAKIGIQNQIYKAPLEVVGLKVNGLDIEAGEEFTANPDWIKQLVIVVKNTSKRDLIGVGANVEFAYGEKNEPLLPEIEFKAGFYPRAKLGATDFLLRAGETKALPLPAGWHNAVDQGVAMAAELKRPSLLYSVIVKPEYATFSATEYWQVGSYFRYENDKWVVDKAAMERVSREVREYWLNAPPRMLKASATFKSCWAYPPLEDATQCLAPSCPTCLQDPFVPIPSSQGGGVKKARFRHCFRFEDPDIVECFCIFLEEYILEGTPCQL